MGLIASAQGLKTVEKARLAKGWARQASIWYGEAHVELPTLKRFLAGKVAVRQENFEAICKAVGVDWKQIVDWEKSGQNRVEDNSDIAQICLKEDCNEMHDVQIFYGREQELENLKQSILQNRSRVVTLCGQPGIGKTALAAKLAEEVKSDFEYFSWRSLNDSVAPSLLKLLSGLIKFLCSEEETDFPSDVDELIDKLLNIFSNHRVLLVLDGWENISRTQSMEGSQTDYEKYSKLLKRIAERKHKSCVVITTQEEPKELSSLQDTPCVKTRLKGLDFQASLKILNAKKLIFVPQQAEKLINDYNGNPLALNHICEHIQKVFAGNVSHYETKYTILFPLEFETAINKNCEFL
ncbi:MAG: AAA family ATPase [Pelatocladus maniniholoensis HA4357-MV3]|jgi:cytidylate kinase|uniref:AAA family ATPase n=1 Tax=Pelatocladus maniniholoensis HA4357-MV3 TaxID=1117104 RepID=A0A9E3HBG4_9NOST|nr:AAA family ATPase [Pelatocladus maniniholoensis HA4357-MV3]